MIFESPLQIERLERPIRVLARTRPHLRSDALPLTEHRLLDFGYVCFHGRSARLTAGDRPPLRPGSHTPYRWRRTKNCTDLTQLQDSAEKSLLQSTPLTNSRCF